MAEADGGEECPSFVKRISCFVSDQTHRRDERREGRVERRTGRPVPAPRDVGLQNLIPICAGRGARGGGSTLVEFFRNSRDHDHAIAVSWSVPAFHFGHASVDPRPSDNGCCPAPPSRRKGTAYDRVTRTDLTCSGCYKVGQVQGQATVPSLSHIWDRSVPLELSG